MTKYYFLSESDEYCYPLAYHLDNAKSDKLEEIELFEAVPEKVNGVFWCRSEQEITEDGYCGKDCADYAPKNGKSGMCQHKSNTLYTHGEKKIFKVKIP